MRETVTISVGQCGNQIGNNFWNQLLLEHEKTPDGDESLSAFFRFSLQKDGRTRVMKARALLIDMECGPLQETMRGPLGALFDETQFVYDVSGSGNNFAQGHYMYGPKYRTRFQEGLRRNAEQCDSLQTFLVTHSLGGGTGSGVGTYLLGLLADEYPKICRFSTCVYPSEDNDVVTSPYNVMLATRELIDHADCVFPLDNSALFAFAQRESVGRPHPSNEETNAAAAKGKGSKDRGFDAINNVAARMLCHLTSSSRFSGEMNVDLNEIYTNLVPFPRLHFLVTALSIQQRRADKGSSQLLSASQRTNSMTHGSAKSSATAAGGRHGARAALQRAFGDVLSERGQIAAAFPTANISHAMNISSSPVQVGAHSHITLSSAFLARGKADSLPLTDFLDCVTTAQRSLNWPTWNRNACKIGMCSTPSPGEDMSVLAVFNSTAFGTVLTREMKGFQRLFRKKAMLHHYTEFVEEREVASAEHTTATLLQEYALLEQSRSIAESRSVSAARSNGFLDADSARFAPVQLFPAF